MNTEFLQKFSIKKAWIFISLIFPSLFLPAQRNDAGLWTSLTAEKRVTQSFSFYVNESFRFDENISRIGGFFTEAGFQQKLIKNMRISLCYRFYQKKGANPGFTEKHRYFADLACKKKISKLTVAYRTRIQSQVENYFFLSERLYGNTPVNYWRNKFSLSYSLAGRYKPFASAEFWKPFGNPKKTRIDNIRFTTGFQYALNKRNSVDVSYILQKEILQKNPATDYILALEYSFAF